MSVKLAIGYGLREGPFIVHRVKLAAALFKLVGLYSALWMTEDNAALWLEMTSRMVSVSLNLEF